jgi:predicted alpha/beta superfamily hydrolase
MRKILFSRFLTALLLICLVLPATGALAASCVLVVSVPATTPDDAQIWITGNHDRLGNWNGKGAQLKEIGPKLYEFSADLPAGSEIEFKVTRGSFASVEKTAQGHEKPNRKIRISGNKEQNERISVEAWADQLASTPAQPEISGWYSLFRNVKSENLEPARDVIVWLPPSYPRNRTLRYPVIYMHDGQNLFDANTAFGGNEWGVDEVMLDYIAGAHCGQLNEAIVVGIYNTSERMSEYTPFPDPKHSGGNGDNYVKFIVEELKPMIDKQFRTRPDRQNTFIGGSSLGGLISLYAGISHPQTFGGIIAMSPSIWWANGAIIDWLLEHNIAGYQGKIWVDMGTREGEEAIGFTRKLAGEIAKKAPELKSLRYREFSGATHSEKSWHQRLHLPLRYLLAPAERP